MCGYMGPEHEREQLASEQSYLRQSMRAAVGAISSSQLVHHVWQPVGNTVDPREERARLKQWRSTSKRRSR